MARILVVDDEALIALNTRDVLADDHHTIVGPAYRLGAAVALASVEPLDGAVLDINVAGCAVWPVAQILADRGIAFVFVTGYGSLFQVPRVFKHAPVLRKPFVDSQLMATVADLVRNHEHATKPS